MTSLKINSCYDTNFVIIGNTVQVVGMTTCCAGNDDITKLALYQLLVFSDKVYYDEMIYFPLANV